MSPKRTWYEWIEAFVARFETAKKCADYLEIDESKLSRWRRMPLQEPTMTDMEMLAAKTRTPLPDILLMVWAAVKARDEMRARPIQGGRPLESLPPTSRRAADRRARMRRRRLAALLLGFVSGTWSGVPPPAVARSPITDQPQVSVSIRDSVALRRRRAA